MTVNDGTENSEEDAMETKHTPGPWVKMGATVVAGSLVIVPKLLGRNGKCVSSDLDGIVQISADLHLIAASPEMLKALKTIANCHDESSDDEGIIAARKAIAKAEGR